MFYFVIAFKLKNKEMLKNVSLDMVKLGQLLHCEAFSFCPLYFTLLLQKHLSKYDKNDKKNRDMDFIQRCKEEMK